MRAIFGLLALLLSSAALAASPLEVSDAWVREAPPNARVLAGFMNLHNRTSDPLVVHGVSSPRFQRAELHRTVMHEGIARMEAVKQLTLRPGETVALAPGGLHLMLFDPSSRPTRGERVEIILETERHGVVSIQAEVRAAGKAAHQHH